MPKRTFKIDDFSGGVNSFQSPQNLKNNEVVQSQGFLIEPGEVSVLGDMKAAYTISAHYVNVDIEAGRGLFVFSNDYTNTGALGSTNYTALLDGVTIDIHIGSGNGTSSGHWTVAGINFGGAVSDNQWSAINPSGFYTDGAFRVSPGSFELKANGERLDAADETDDIQPATIFYGKNQSHTTDIGTLSQKITAGDTLVIQGQEMIALLVVDAGGDDTLDVGRNMTGLFPSKIDDNQLYYTILDSRWHGLTHAKYFPQVTTLGTFTDWYGSFSTPRPPVPHSALYDAGNVDPSYTFPFLVNFDDGNILAADDSSAVDGDKSPCVNIGYTAATDDGNATWDGAVIRLYISALYDDGKQESQPNRYTPATEITVAAAKELGIYVGVEYSSDASNYMIHKRVSGARLYFEDSTGDPGVLYQLLEIDFNKGTRKVGVSSFDPWIEEEANKMADTKQAGQLLANRNSGHATGAYVFPDPLKLITYEINTGYRVDTTIHARYKTAAICNRRLFAANIYQNGVAHGDRMIGSPVNKFDILPETNAIDVTVGDGDEIVKLESFGDRIFQFKKRTLYIINVSNGVGGEYLESEHKNMGIQNPSQSCKTELGIAWVNSKGVFLFDGKNIKDLYTNKLKLSSSTRPESMNIDEDNVPLIGFNPTKKWLIIHPQSTVSGANENEAWIWNMKNGAWMYTTKFTYDGDYKTNMVWTADDELIFAGGTSSSDTPSFYKYQASTAISAPSADALVFLTKEFDLDVPNIKKKINSVSITYSVVGSGVSVNSNIEADLIYKTSASGAATTVALIEEKGNDNYYENGTGFKGTDALAKTVRLEPSSPVKGAYTFQLKLHNDTNAYTVAADFKLYSISFSYRTMGVR